MAGRVFVSKGFSKQKPTYMRQIHVLQERGKKSFFAVESKSFLGTAGIGDEHAVMTPIIMAAMAMRMRTSFLSCVRLYRVLAMYVVQRMLPIVLQ